MVKYQMNAAINKVIERVAQKFNQKSEELAAANEKIRQMEGHIQLLENKLRCKIEIPDRDDLTDMGNDDVDMKDTVDVKDAVDTVTHEEGEPAGSAMTVSNVDSKEALHQLLSVQPGNYKEDPVAFDMFEKLRRVSEENNRIVLVLRCHVCKKAQGDSSDPSKYGIHLMSCIWTNRKRKVIERLPELAENIGEADNFYYCNSTKPGRACRRKKTRDEVMLHRLKYHLGFEQAVLNGSTWQSDKALGMFHLSLLGCESRMFDTKSHEHYADCQLESIF